MVSDYNINLDVHKTGQGVQLRMKKTDTARRIYVTFNDGGNAFSIPDDAVAVFAGLKPDGKVLYNHCNIVDNTAVYDVTPQTTAVEGVVECELRLMDKTGGIITSPDFSIMVEAQAVDDSDIISKDEVTELAHLILEAQRKIDEMNQGLSKLDLAIQQISKLLNQKTLLCTTAAATAEKTVDVPEDHALPLDGGMVYVVFQEGNSAQNPSLSLVSTETITAPIVTNDGKGTPANNLTPNMVYELRYNGGKFEVMNTGSIRQATKDELGGVKADAKLPWQKLPVGIDPTTGKLYSDISLALQSAKAGQFPVVKSTGLGGVPIEWELKDAEHGIFVAEYGKTKFNEVNDALRADMDVIVPYNNLIYRIFHTGLNTAVHEFAAVTYGSTEVSGDEAVDISIMRLKSDNKWVILPTTTLYKDTASLTDDDQHIPTSKLVKAELAKIPGGGTSGIFMAKYGVTTYNEVKSAYASGKLVIVDRVSTVAVLNGYGSDYYDFVGERYPFNEGFDLTGIYQRVVRVNNKNEWYDMPITKMYLQKSGADLNDSDNYVPSCKAVKEAIQKSGSNPLVTIDVEVRSENNFWTKPVTTAQQIIDLVNANKEVRLHFFDTITGTGDQIYSYETTLDGVPYFRRNVVKPDEVSRINIGVQYNGEVKFTDIPYVPPLMTAFATCTAEAAPAQSAPVAWYIPKSMPRPSGDVGMLVDVLWKNGRSDGLGYDISLVWGEEGGSDNEVIVPTASVSSDLTGQYGIPAEGTVRYQLVEQSGRKRWKYVSGDLISRQFSTATPAATADKVVPGMEISYLPGMDIYLQLDEGNTADLMQIVPAEGATLPVYGNGTGAKTGSLPAGYILHLKNAGDHWQIINSPGEGGSGGPLKPLTFTGAVSAEYDGTVPVTVPIPAGGGGMTDVVDYTTLEPVGTIGLTLPKSWNEYKIIKIKMEVPFDDAIKQKKLSFSLWKPYTSAGTLIPIEDAFSKTEAHPTYIVGITEIEPAWGSAPPVVLGRYASSSHGSHSQGSLNTLEGFYKNWKEVWAWCDTGKTNFPTGTHIRVEARE